MRSPYPCLYILASLLACGPGGGTPTTTGDETTNNSPTSGGPVGGTTGIAGESSGGSGADAVIGPGRGSGR